MSINKLIALAEQGNTQATAELACAYLNGENTERDLEKGAALMLKAAQAGHALAALNVSFMYKDGDGVQQSFQKAEEWALRAAKLGEPEELGHIALAYIVGNGADKNPYETDYDKAFRYLKICSDSGDADSRARLGVCYEEGWGTETDVKKAIECYRESAEAGSEYGFEKYASVHDHELDKNSFISKNLDLIKSFADKECGLAQDLLADAYFFGYGESESKELSIIWREKAASNGESSAQCRIAEWYANGWNGKPVDDEKALTLWLSAAEKGHRLAKVCAANRLIEHTYSPQDQAKAIAYYTEIAELGLQGKPVELFVDAQLYLGDCYLKGKGVAKDVVLAEMWLSEAAKNNNSLAQFLLATKIYLNVQNDKAAYWLEKLVSDNDEKYVNSALDLLGQIYMISTKEYNKAVPILKKAVEKGIGGSQSVYLLGMCYAHALGVATDVQQAIYFLQKASDAGHKGAQTELEALIKKNEATPTNTKSKFGLGRFFKK